MHDLLTHLDYPEALDLYQTLTNLGLAGSDGETISIASSHSDLQKVFNSKIQIHKTGMLSTFQKTIDHEKDIMDRSIITQNLFLKFSNDGSTETIIPIKLEYDFIHKITEGFASRFGHTTEVKAQ